MIENVLYKDKNLYKFLDYKDFKKHNNKGFIINKNKTIFYCDLENNLLKEIEKKDKLFTSLKVKYDLDISILEKVKEEEYKNSLEKYVILSYGKEEQKQEKEQLFESPISILEEKEKKRFQEDKPFNKNHLNSFIYKDFEDIKAFFLLLKNGNLDKDYIKEVFFEFINNSLINTDSRGISDFMSSKIPQITIMGLFCDATETLIHHQGNIISKFSNKNEILSKLKVLSMTEDMIFSKNKIYNLFKAILLKEDRIKLKELVKETNYYWVDFFLEETLNKGLDTSSANNFYKSITNFFVSLVRTHIYYQLEKVVYEDIS